MFLPIFHISIVYILYKLSIKCRPVDLKIKKLDEKDGGVGGRRRHPKKIAHGLEPRSRSTGLHNPTPLSPLSRIMTHTPITNNCPLINPICLVHSLRIDKSPFMDGIPLIPFGFAYLAVKYVL